MPYPTEFEPVGDRYNCGLCNAKPPKKPDWVVHDKFRTVTKNKGEDNEKKVRVCRETFCCDACYRTVFFNAPWPGNQAPFTNIEIAEWKRRYGSKRDW